MEFALKEVLSQKREIEPLLNSLNANNENSETIITNLQKNLKDDSSKLKLLLLEENSMRNRITALTSNKFIKSIAKMLLSEKIEELKNNLTFLKKKISLSKKNIERLKKKISNLQKKQQNAQTSLIKISEKMEKVLQAKKEIEMELKRLGRKRDSIKSKNIFDTAKVVGATLISSALNQKIQNAEFDMIIVDEASMALIPTLVVVSQALKKNSKVKPVKYKPIDGFTDAQNEAVKRGLSSQLIFVGDPKQLSPIAKTEEMKQTIFQYYNVEKLFSGEKVENSVFLDINFRNHPHITALASKLFYGGLLKSGKKEDGKSSLFIKRTISDMIPSDGSYINTGNIGVVKDQIRLALSKGRREIGVITPYRKQAQMLNNNFYQLKQEYPDADIQAGTIHKFQGKEKEIIIFDLTFSPKGRNELPATYAGDINSEVAKLLNVAMTRAESFFILIGDTDGILNINENSILKDWVDAITKIK